MIKVEKKCDYIKIYGHADFDTLGKDIVCAGVSALVLNTINSIETFRDDEFTCEVQEKNGDVLIKKVDLNNLINEKKPDAIKMEVHLMSLSREEEFLKTLKELQKILN